QLTQVIHDRKKAVGIGTSRESVYGGQGLFKGSPDDMTQVSTCGLLVQLFAGQLSFHYLREHGPVGGDLTLRIGRVSKDFTGFYVEEGQVSEDIVDIGSTPRHLHIHDLIVQPIAIPLSLRRNQRSQMRGLVAFPADQSDIAALFDSLGK